MAESAQVQLPIFDFPVVSNDDAPKDPKPGDKWKEQVWKEDPPPGSWNRGEPLGEIEVQALGPPESPNFHAEFPAGDDDPIKIDGKVPGPWQGKGTAKAKGKGREKNIPIEFKNPKRWG
jgi:hypothetical protein